MKITQKSLKHAADKFEKQFERDEMGFVIGLGDSASNQTKILTLSQTLSTFKVARNFRRKFDLEAGLKRYEPVLNLINDLDLTLDPVALVLKIESELSKSYGGGKFISAATKLAWLLTTEEDSFSSVIIYDSYACNALKNLGYLNSRHTYDEYLIAWRDAFNANSELIKHAIKGLEKNPNFELRVFDLQLYEIGAAYAK